MGVGVFDIDHGWKQIRRALESAKGAHTKVGVQADTRREDASSMVVIAAAHEFGTEDNRPPERSWLRSTHDENRERIAILMRAEWKQILLGRSTPMRSLALIGEWLEAKIKAKIRKGIAPPLAEATIRARRGADPSHKGARVFVPLIDTAQFVQSIRHVEVAGGKGKTATA